MGMFKTTQSNTVVKSLREKYKDVTPVAIKTTTPQPYVIDGCEPRPTHECPGYGGNMSGTQAAILQWKPRITCFCQCAGQIILTGPIKSILHGH